MTLLLEDSLLAAYINCGLQKIERWQRKRNRLTQNENEPSPDRQRIHTARTGSVSAWIVKVF